MSVRTDVVNLNINVNGNKAQNELNNLRKRAADLSFEMKGLKKGTDEYITKGKELEQVNAQMTSLKKQIGLTALTQKELIAELNKLKSLKGSIVPFSNEFKELDKQIKQVENRLYDVKNGTQGFASFFSKIKDEVKQFGVIAAGYLGFQFITSQFTNVIRSAGKMSDQLTDLQRVAGLTAAEAKHMNDQFKELNTRTSTEGLREIAIIAGKLGVAKDDIFDFTAAVDQLVVSLGDELGDAEQITTQLGKILNVFQGEISAEGITQLGNAFVQLANTGSATGGFIADFDQRLSGIAKSAGIGLGGLSGLGAGLEEMGARVESSSTAIQKLIVSIASDIPKAAQVAGLGTKEFEKLFKDDAIEALLRYSEGLVKNKQSFSEVTASLADAGEEGARTIEVISKLGSGAEQLRKRIDLGKQSIQENSAITEAFTLKNENFAATLDKLGKEFNRLVTSPGITNFLKGAVEGALAFVKAIRDIPKFVEENRFAVLTLVAGILLLNRQYVISAALSIRDAALKAANTVATRATAIANNIAGASAAAYGVVTSLLAGRITAATAAQRLWAVALSVGLGPIGILLTAVGALAVAFGAFSGKLSAIAAQQKAANELAREAATIYGEQVNKVERLQKVLTDENTSLATKKEAYKQLIAIHPEFEKTLKLDEAGHLNGKAAIDEYIKGLKEKAQVQAAETLSNKLNVEILEKQEKLSRTTGAFRGFSTNISDLKKEIANLQQQKAFYDNILNKAIEKKATPTGTNNSNSNDAAAITSKTIATIKAQLTDLDKAYENIDISNKKALASNRAARKELQDQLDALEGKKTPGQKSDDSQYKRLKAEAEKFYKEIQDLKKRIDKGESPEVQEIQRAAQKYEELLQKAKDFYIRSAIDKKRFTEEEKIIEEQKQRELNEIFQKYFKKRFDEGRAQQYDDVQIVSTEKFDQEKIKTANFYAEGKISKIEYEKELTNIDNRETAARIEIAEEFSTTVKKAAKDVYEFKKNEEKKTTQDLIKQAEARAALANEEKDAKFKLAILKAGSNNPAINPLSSKSYVNLLKADLEREKQLKIKAKKEEYAALGIVLEDGNAILLKIDEEYNQKIKDLDGQHIRAKIEQIQTYIGWVQQALGSLNQFINNRENSQFQKEKALNAKKAKEYRSQLANKLISQAQFDKKMNELQEEQDRKERELKRKQAKREKALNLFRAIVNVAAGVASSLSYGGPVGIALAAITAVLGALEIAAIASQPLPEAGKGKYFGQGDKHSDPSGGIPIKVERGEAVVTAAAMDDDKQYMVTGTPKQITSALNSQAGGVSWAGGAIVRRIPLISDRPARINPNLPANLEKARGAGGGDTQNMNLDSIVNEMKILRYDVSGLRTDINKWQTNLKAHVVLREIKDKEKAYNDAIALSGFGPGKDDFKKVS